MLVSGEELFLHYVGSLRRSVSFLQTLVSRKAAVQRVQLMR